MQGADDSVGLTVGMNSNQKRKNMLDELKNAMASYNEHSNHTILEENGDEELASQPSVTTMQVNKNENGVFDGETSVARTIQSMSQQ